MKYGRIPHLDKPISRIVAGTDYLIEQDKNVSFRAYDLFWEQGGRCFDSAHIYGRNSNIFGEWLASRFVVDEAVLLDKGCHPSNRPRVTREDIFSDIRENHQRLGVGYTDLFVLHRDDPSVPVGDVVDWLNEAKDEGLIGGFGGSNWDHTRVAAANEYADSSGKQGFSVNNPNLSLATPKEPMWGGCVSLDREGRAWHEKTGFPLFAWSSMARGFFAGAEDGDTRRVYYTEENFARRDRACEFAKKLGVTPPQIALAWVLNQPMNVYALCGLRNEEQVKQAVEAVEISLSPEDLRYLEHGSAT